MYKLGLALLALEVFVSLGIRASEFKASGSHTRCQTPVLTACTAQPVIHHFIIHHLMCYVYDVGAV